MISIINNHKSLRLLLSVLLALALWQMGAVLFSRSMGLGGFLVAAPTDVLRRLLVLLTETGFWQRVWFSFYRILYGFFAALILGSAAAAAAGRFPLLETFLWPYITVVKTTPVASFIILCLIWMGSDNLSAAISFLMVLPIIYSNALEGIHSTDRYLIEMADVFHVGWTRRVLYIYLPQLKPYLISACGLSLGMTWKSGVAAEVIGIPGGSIGEMLYEAKVYLNARDLFAWTAVIILISAGFEKGFMTLLVKLYDRLEAIGKPSRRQGRRFPRGTGIKSGSETGACEEDDLFCEICGDLSGGEDVAVTGISKTFGEKKVLENFSAVFPAGKCTCIMGDSGSGKTTLLRILMGLVVPDTGAVTGTDGQNTGAVFQEDRLCDSFNAVANVGFACGVAVSRKQIAAHLTALGLGDSLYQPVRVLSGGMRRRVAIARAVLACGQILYLDEPFKGLDEQNRETVAEYILREGEGKTILMVTHSLEEVELMGGGQPLVIPTVNHNGSAALE